MERMMTFTCQSRTLPFALALLASGTFALTACGPPLRGDGVGPLSSNALGSTEGVSENGMSQNGMSQNGMSQNGMSQNGLSYNGLDVNGLATKGLGSSQFDSWFNRDPSVASVVMTYAVRCAYPSGSWLSWTNSATGIGYTWSGNLGLAPVWASGKAIPAAEQQLVSACLAAHVNKFGVHLALSIRGLKSDGRTTIAMGATEARDFPYDEACFFGNLFAGQGVYLGADQSSMNPNVTTPRGCAVEAGVPGECSPIVHAGMCKDFCTRDTKTGLLKSCTANGVTFKPLTTFLQDADVYKCGDGVCQFTEQPYDPVTKTGCSRDCGSL
jgi:hypothetical protein